MFYVCWNAVEELGAKNKQLENAPNNFHSSIQFIDIFLHSIFYALVVHKQLSFQVFKLMLWNNCKHFKNKNISQKSNEQN